MAISVVGEGSYKHYIKFLPEIVKNVVLFLRDPHPRVRWAACNTIGQLSTDFGPGKRYFILFVFARISQFLTPLFKKQKQQHRPSKSIP